MTARVLEDAAPTVREAEADPHVIGPDTAHTQEGASAAPLELLTDCCAKIGSLGLRAR